MESHLIDSNFFDKQLGREFRSVVNALKKANSSNFNLNVLGIEPPAITKNLLFFVKIKGIHRLSDFATLNDEIHFVSSKKELEDNGHYAFSNKNKNLRAPRDFRLVAVNRVIPVKNNYKSPDDNIRYAGIEQLEDGTVLQYFWVNESYLYPMDTYAVTISIKRVSHHLGGRSLTLTNGCELNLVVQDRRRMRNTDTKNVYFVAKTIGECEEFIRHAHDHLVHKGIAFNYSFFDVESEVEGLFEKQNLTYKEVHPTMDVYERLEELSLVEEEF